MLLAADEQPTAALGRGSWRTHGLGETPVDVPGQQPAGGRGVAAPASGGAAIAGMAVRTDRNNELSEGNINLHLFLIFALYAGVLRATNYNYCARNSLQWRRSVNCE